MINGFTEEETKNIRQAKEALYVFCRSSITMHDWAAIIFNSGSKFPHDKISGSYYVSGGAIASLLLQEAPKDFDVYCREKVLASRLLSTLKPFIDNIKDVDERYREVNCWKVPGKMVTENSITMSNNMSFIAMQSGEPHQIKSTFDFLHCTPHYDIANDKLYISRAQYDAIMSKTLVVNNPAEVTEWRMKKFIDRGWKLGTNPEEVINLAAKNVLVNQNLTPAVMNS